jgi:hypothetical protein
MWSLLFIIIITIIVIILIIIIISFIINITIIDFWYVRSLFSMILDLTNTKFIWD